jgi:endonuclease G
MANSLVIHGAVFAVGALVGGGIAATISRKSEATSPQNITRTQQPVAPILQVGTTGNAVIATNVGVVSPPLKYGNPGMQPP